MPTRYALERAGEAGWCEVTKPAVGGEYEAYREICEDPECPSAWPPSVHSHIVEEATSGPWSSVLDEAPRSYGARIGG